MTSFAFSCGWADFAFQVILRKHSKKGGGVWPPWGLYLLVLRGCLPERIMPTTTGGLHLQPTAAHSQLRPPALLIRRSVRLYRKAWNSKADSAGSNPSCWCSLKDRKPGSPWSISRTFMCRHPAPTHRKTLNNKTVIFYRHKWHKWSQRVSLADLLTSLYCCLITLQKEEGNSITGRRFNGGLLHHCQQTRADSCSTSEDVNLPTSTLFQGLDLPALPSAAWCSAQPGGPATVCLFYSRYFVTFFISRWDAASARCRSVLVMCPSSEERINALHTWRGLLFSFHYYHPSVLHLRSIPYLQRCAQEEERAPSRLPPADLLSSAKKGNGEHQPTALESCHTNFSTTLKAPAVLEPS